MTDSSSGPQSAHVADFRIEDLLQHGSFPHPVTALELRETHISWVVLTGTYAYKIKKPVKLDFLDATALATRRLLCDEELRLNRRLAPGIYEAVVAISRNGAVVAVDGAGTVVEYAVRMRQFPPAAELPALLKRGEVAAHDFVALAESLADFHEAAAGPPGGNAYPFMAELRKSVLGTQATLLSHLDGSEELPSVGLLIDWIHDSLKSLATRFRSRHQGGFVRECHGDLHAGNIVRWNGQLTPFDCLEFDPRLRFIDVMNDIAFLVMDLIAHERRDLAYAFLDRYVERTGDYEGLRLLPFYAVYRALVRAMVDALAAEQMPAKRTEFRRRLQGRLRVAAAFMNPPRPLLIIMHGPSGSGKSWLSERLVPALGAIRLRSDIERRRLSVQDTELPDAEGRYAPMMLRRTYARLAASAESALLGGINTLVDATFLHAKDRQVFRALAARCGSRFVIVSCVADESTMVDRVGARQRVKADPSEADVSVLREQLSRLEPLQDDELPCMVESDTAARDAVSTLSAALQSRIERAGH